LIHAGKESVAEIALPLAIEVLFAISVSEAMESTAIRRIIVLDA
jgi:hypothetical protein